MSYKARMLIIRPFFMDIPKKKKPPHNCMKAFFVDLLGKSIDFDYQQVMSFLYTLIHDWVQKM